MKMTTFQCDRCDAKAAGRYEHHYARTPSGWSNMAFDDADYDLCPACAEDVRLMLANMKLERKS